MEFDAFARGFPVACVDLGTTSIHMLIARRVAKGVVETLATDKEILRLGQALGKDQRLGDGPLGETCAALVRMGALARHHGAYFLVKATHVLRQAKNAREFCHQVGMRTGVRVGVISGYEEARLIYLGMVHGLELPGAPRTIALDIGGGSAEIILGEGDRAVHRGSLKLGAIHLTNTLLGGVREEDGLRAVRRRTRIKSQTLGTLAQGWGSVCNLLSGGTARGIKNVAEGLAGGAVPWGTGQPVVLTLQEILQVRRALAQTPSPRGRRELPGMGSKRAEFLPAGCEILLALSRSLGVDTWTIARSSFREGILLDTLQTQYALRFGKPPGREAELQRLGAQLGVEWAPSALVDRLRIACIPAETQLVPGFSDLCRAGAVFLSLARRLPTGAPGTTAAHLALGTDLPGWHQWERRFVAEALGGWGTLALRSPREERSLRWAGALVRLAVAVSAGPGPVALRWHWAAGTLHLHLGGSSVPPAGLTPCLRPISALLGSPVVLTCD